MFPEPMAVDCIAFALKLLGRCSPSARVVVVEKPDRLLRRWDRLDTGFCYHDGVQLVGLFAVKGTLSRPTNPTASSPGSHRAGET